MSAGCMRWALNRALSNAWRAGPALRTPAAAAGFLKTRDGSAAIAAYLESSPYSTAEDDRGAAPAPRRPKKTGSGGTDFSAGSVGRRIPHSNLELLSEAGESLGTVHRVNAIKMMDSQGLKLVLIDGDKEPPVYQLMTGKQLHVEQLKQREIQKAKPAAVQVKELVLSTVIASHDLSNKLSQVEGWLNKRHHVQITLRSGRKEATVNLDATLEQMVGQIKVPMGFVSLPKVTRNGRAAACVVRPPSAKELAKLGKKSAGPDSADSGGSRTEPKAVGAADATDGSMQQ